ncbi:glycosyltransferase family 4 protein [Pedobacter sp. CCM 8938]|uniref:Glycosyltransferase family 4 protein n=1 Tax=Pedobacter fastidiosus TaxID=2765361 RepID=A0ABR7KSJ9_9SPHI|nr:glycosyltransferase family 1 protein [Pedobacter fastidiosus]MBC6111025.1 glycosyltransferase family 4 protein [Pedobacter fastidiosus]
MLSQQEKRYNWNKKYSKYLIKKNDFDLLHPTYYEPYFLKKLKKPYVITVHDMIHELLPDSFPSNDVAALQKKEVIKQAAKIITISETTKNDLKNILGIPDHRIEVIHHGYQLKKKQNEITNQDSQKDEYILFVGARSGYKNFNRFIVAVSPLLKSRTTLRLICTGGGAFQKEEINLFKKLAISNNILQANVSDEQLDSLYSNAMAFVFPSIYEGFGLPILEAFQNRCPAILSNSNCFKEVAATAAEYFDPNDEHSILNAIIKVIDHVDFADDLIKKGEERLQHFKPEYCVQKTISLYKSLS